MSTTDASSRIGQTISIREPELTPDELFDEFRKANLDFGWLYGYKGMEKFERLEDKTLFLEETIKFVNHEKEDSVRSWGITVLGLIPERRAFDTLVQTLETVKDEKKKRKYALSRFFALKGIVNLANSRHAKEVLIPKTQKKPRDTKEVLFDILMDMWNKDDEHYLVKAGVAIIITRQEKANDDLKGEATTKIKDMLSPSLYDERTFWALRALREFSVPELVDDIISVIEKDPNYYHKRYAIQALGSYYDDLKAVRELGYILRKEVEDSFRLEAVKSLAKIKHPDSKEDLILALRDNNAEIRVQASNALKLVLKDEAIPTIVQCALKEGIEQTWLIHLVEALRLIGQDRILSTQALSKELGNEDQRRSRVAEQILIDLGGWAAVQKVSQRQNTLERLDRLLEQSEQAIKDTFHDTINQARRNFYFAMGINIIIVIVGIVLVVLAIMQVIQEPENLEAWIIPGAAGLFGILITMFFNNPRKNAREDLTTLLNVNVMFLGYLRRLNQIDATFKYAYIESRSFGTEEMNQTIKQIDAAVTQTLRMAQNYLVNPKQSPIQITDPNETE